MNSKMLSALLIVLVVWTVPSCRRQDNPREVEEPSESFGLRKTGASVAASIEVEDPLIRDGEFVCHETEITDGPEAGKFTPEIEGGTIRHKESEGFRAVIDYVIEAGGQRFSGTENLTIGAGGSGLTSIHLNAEENETSPLGPITFLHIPKGLSSCNLTISAG